MFLVDLGEINGVSSSLMLRCCDGVASDGNVDWARSLRGQVCELYAGSCSRVRRLPLFV